MLIKNSSTMNKLKITTCKWLSIYKIFLEKLLNEWIIWLFINKIYKFSLCLNRRS